MGTASMTYYIETKQLVRRADKAMYKEKQSRHIGG